VAFAGITAPHTSSTPPSRRTARGRRIRSAQPVVVPIPDEAAVPATTDLRLVDDALLDWRNSV
jgi:hypothetical protein